MTRRTRRAAYWRRDAGLRFAKALLNEPSRREVRRADRVRRRPSPKGLPAVFAKPLTAPVRAL